MFVTYPDSELEMPVGLGAPGARHWRVAQLTLHAPWFVLTITPAETACEGGLLQTLLIASERDLVEVLRSVHPGRIRSLVCMMPGWRSPSGQWMSREVREVWLGGEQDSPNQVWLVDVNGVPFDAGLHGLDSGFEAAKKSLLLCLQTAATNRGKPSRRRGQPTRSS